ncbi:MAG: protein-L-isoaspartate(D-aspartate) O-methyltransferase [Magnetovibrio sp.]|nr:protein-L-isoaspartate(D-aspartate) O-methyltransferase [Magnetovibrio sp.]
MDPKKREKAHHKMMREIEDDARDTGTWTGRSRFSDSTMAAMAAVQRHLFVDDDIQIAAYVNRPQRIGHGQTISQPYIVALMTDFLDLTGSEKVLEIGTGSGYQAAVLAEVLKQGRVFTIEIVEPLAKMAAKRLRELDYDNVTVRHGDGYKGWPEEAPFDAVIVTAAPETIPEALVEQLKPGGRMIVPIGRAHDRQTLTLVRKDAAGQVTVDKVLPVAFVPMVKDRN